MFCPNCGDKLVKPNQKFCQKCGSAIKTPSKTTISAPTTPYLSQQKPVKISGQSGPYSQKCLGFALASFIMAIAMIVIFGFSIIFFVLIRGRRLGFGLIIFILIHIVGLILGIFARINSEKAGKFEPENAAEKVGSVFAIFGIIVNVIPMVIIFIILMIVL